VPSRLRFAAYPICLRFVPMKHKVINYQLDRASSLAALIPCGQCRRGSMRPSTRMARATPRGGLALAGGLWALALMSPPDDRF
jgi:hypothetical protein